MAGSHRAQRDRPPRVSTVPRWAIVAAVVLALLPAIWFTARRVVDNAAAPSGSATVLPIPPVSPSTTPPTRTPPQTPSPTPTQAPSPSATPVQLTQVSPDAPRRLVSGSLLDTGFDSAATTLDASSTSEVARWGSRGSPGSPGTDTVFVAGRVAGSGSAFENLPRLRPGAKVSIRTDSGTLTYTVTSATLKTAAGLAGDPVVSQRTPGRLVLVGIRYDGSGNRQSDVLVVTARLTGAQKA